MSGTSIIMMVLVLGFYGVGFVKLVNKAFKSKETE